MGTVISVGATAAGAGGERPILVTGGAGFIGANFVLDWLAHDLGPVITLDKLTYAGNLDNLARTANDPRHIFVEADIGDFDRVSKLLADHRPRAVVNFAAETHVDRSIHGAGDFIATNVVGTFQLLSAVRAYLQSANVTDREAFRFVHVSTDEVFGSLRPDEAAFTEQSRYVPNNPYSASKAASDHLVRAWHHTYGLPVLVSNCSNNYGPYQFPEKLIPLMIHNALRGQALPVYGDGRQVRDWLFVLDHCSAIRAILERGRVGETYNVGGGGEKANIEVVHLLCDILDSESPCVGGGSYRDQIKFVPDRPGHDRRYAIDSSKLSRELDWRPAETFETGLRRTVRWYLDNTDWVDRVASGSYRNWVKQNYSAR